MTYKPIWAGHFRWCTEECPSGTMPIRYYAHQNNAHQELCPSAYFQGWRFAHQFFYPSFFLLKLYLFKGLIIFLGKECLPGGLGALSVSKLSETNGLYVGFINILLTLIKYTYIKITHHNIHTMTLIEIALKWSKQVL